jgi:hypothetical protein
MSTSYYLKKGGCGLNGCCEQSWHIGLRAQGWRFHFHDQSPLGPRLGSAAEWKEVIEHLTSIRDGKGHAVWRLVNEYEEDYSPDEFWKMVESTRGGKGQNEHAGRTHFDADGWCLDSDEFS